MIRIGIDIGGTFTDLCAVTPDGRCWSAKLLTTPADPSAGFLAILDRAFRADPAYRDVRAIVHATTLATNALLEGATARLGLITTAGFRDVLEIGRHFRRDLYNFFLEKPPVLVPRERRLEVDERVGAGGAVVRALDRAAAEAAVDQLLAEGVEVILVCFLHSYARPDHEREVAEIVRRRGPVPVITSHTVCGEHREYERFSTAAVHGAVLPRVRGYLHRIATGLRAAGVAAPVAVMQSNGGMAGVDAVLDRPGSVVESGPAAGVIAAVEVGRRLGVADLISFDMGGTTAKATLVRGGRIAVTNDYEVGGGLQGGFGTGYPLRTPVVDVVEVGTGGGSVAFLDEVGRLHVGPRSAGAAPGPACYGLGGTEPTVTDADLVLGRLRPDHFAGGQTRLSVPAARDAIERAVAQPLGLSLEAAAEGVVALADAQMVEALRLVSVRRGHDPRDFVLVAFGGAGPGHAAELARELGCPRVVIPTEAGVQSAWGLLVADARRDFSQAVLGRADALDLPALRRLYEGLVNRGRDELRASGFRDGQLRDRLAIDARYPGQAFEVTVELPGAPDFTAEMAARVNALFHESHDRLYGHSDPGSAVEWVTLRAAVLGEVPRRAPPAVPPARRPLEERRLAVYTMTWAGRRWEAPLYERSALGRGDRIRGPALIVQADSSTAVPPGAELTVEPTGDFVLVIGLAAGPGGGR
jgi:N-methylhydantoinase A